MSTQTTKALSIIGLIILSIILFLGGMFFGRGQVSAAFYPGSMMLSGNGYDGEENSFGPGMMGNFANAPSSFGSMMGSFGGLTNVDPLSIEEAETAVTDYLATLNQDALELGEIMIFDNHAYAQIIDESTESGAFEVLVDPATGSVFPEPGPNMMWNTKYGMMGNSMMGGNMMNSFGYAPDAEINVTANEAINIAQEYLDAYLPGKTADGETVTFPGYYTIHILEDGETIGMLSVNAYTSQVFLHQWHGDFIEMAGEH